MRTVIDCRSAGEQDLAPLYLAGKLPEDVAQAFELHYLGCRECWEDVQAGGKLRATFGRPAVALASAAPRPSRAWLPFAAAAAIALLAAGVWQVARRPSIVPSGRVVRGAAAGLEVAVAPGARGSVEIRWQPQPDAASYEIEIVSSDGALVWKTETPEPHRTIEAGSFPPAPEGRSYSIGVAARDALGQVVAKSAPLALPGR